MSNKRHVKICEDEGGRREREEFREVGRGRGGVIFSRKRRKETRRKRKKRRERMDNPLIKGGQDTHTYCIRSEFINN